MADTSQALYPQKKEIMNIILVVGGSGIYHGAPSLRTLVRSSRYLESTLVFIGSKVVVTPLISFSPNVIALPFLMIDYHIIC